MLFNRKIETTTAEDINGQYPEEIPTPMDPSGMGISRRRFLSALTICPDRFRFEQLLREGGTRRVMEEFPQFAEHDVRILKLHWGLRNHRGPNAKKPTVATITDESFEHLADRLTTRVMEKLAEKLLS